MRIPSVESGRSPGGVHGSILTWRILWTEEPDRLQSMGSKRVRHDWSNLAHTMYAFPTWPYCCSVTQLCPTLCDPMDCSTLGFPVHHLPELAQTHVHWVNDAIQPSHPLLSPSPPASIFPSIRVFSNESALHTRWPNYWSFSYSISPSNEYSGLMSFKMDWLDLLAVPGTLKSLLQHHSSKASIFQCSAFVMLQLSHLNTTTRKAIALTWAILDI